MTKNLLNAALMGAVVFYASAGHAFLDKKEKSSEERFQPYGNNYLIYPQKTIYNRKQNDQQSMEGHYSFKYIITDPRFERETTYEEGDPFNQFFFSYTGEFDFYVNPKGTGRESGPVINRTSNPALHWMRTYNQRPGERVRRSLFGTKATLNWTDISFEHRSDGQVVESKDTDGAGNYLAQLEHQNNPNSEYFDTISMGSNYLKFAAGFTIGDKETQQECDKVLSCYSLDISAKVYMSGDDSDVTWGPTAADDPNIRDYDIIRIRYSSTTELADKIKTFISGYIDQVTLQAEYTFGRTGVKNSSLDVNFIFPGQFRDSKTEIPWFIGLHTGPMDRLSNYTKNMTSIGVGLMLYY